MASGWGNVRGDTISRMYFEALSKKYHFRLDQPIRDLSEEARHAILYGTGGEKLTLHYNQERGTGTLHQPFEGIAANLERRYRETQSPAMRSEIEQCMAEWPCPECGGRRLRPEALAVTVGGLNIAQFCELPVTEALRFLDRAEGELNRTQLLIAGRILKEIRARLGFLQSVGLQYLTLSRTARHLVRGRGAAHSAGHPDRLFPDGGSVYPG